MADNTKFRPYALLKELANPERISMPAIRDQMQNSLILGPSKSYTETMLDNNNIGFLDLWAFCINHYRYSFFETPRSELVIAPDVMSCIPPFCNIVFPDEYVHYGREVKLRGLVTRYFEQGFFTTPGLGSPEANNILAQLAQEAFVAPTSDLQPTMIDVIKGECTPYELPLPGTDDKYTTFRQIPLPEELHYGATYITGEGEYLSRMGEEIAKTNNGSNNGGNSGEVDLAEEYNNFHKLNVMYKYFLTRLQSQKTTQVRITFTPRLIPGLPVLLFSRTGRHILGLITSMSHMIDANGIAETHLIVEYQYLYDDVTKRPLYLLRSRKSEESVNDGDPYVWKNHFMLSDDFRDYKIGKELYRKILCDSINEKDYNGFVSGKTAKLKDKSLLGIHEIIRDFSVPDDSQKEQDAKTVDGTEKNDLDKFGKSTGPLKNKTSFEEYGLKEVDLDKFGTTTGSSNRISFDDSVACLVKGLNTIKLSSGIDVFVETIKIGDNVLVFDLNENKNKIKSVKNVSSKLVNSYFNINDNLFITGEHPIFANEKWIKIKDLNIGDSIKTYNGNIFVTKKLLVKKQVKVYSIEIDAIEGSNNYYANNCLLHNKIMRGTIGASSAYPQPTSIDDLIKRFGDPSDKDFFKNYIVTYDVPPDGQNAFGVKKVYLHRYIKDIFDKTVQGVANKVGWGRVQTWSGMYVKKQIANSSKSSMHSWGLAFDINAESNPATKNFNHANRISDDQKVVGPIIQSYGWEWGALKKDGGDWTSKSDAMHFQWPHGI